MSPRRDLRMIPRPQHFGDRAPFPCRLVGYNADIREAPLRSSPPLRWRPRPLPREAGERKHRAGPSRQARRPRGHSRRSTTGSTVAASKMRSSKPSKRPHRRIAPWPAARSRTRAWVSGVAARRHRQHRPAVGDAVERRGEHVGPQHHPRPAAGRRVVDAAVLVGGEVADLARVEAPQALGQRPPGQADAQRPRKHLRVKRQDGGGERHGGGLVRNSRGRQSIGTRMDEPLDCLIIGGGPAGLTAAIYLARFHLDILRGRRRQEPRGDDPVHPQPCRLSRRDQRQGADRADEGAGAAIRRADRARTSSPGSIATRASCSAPNGARDRSTAKTVLLATGVTNRRPPMDESIARRGAGPRPDPLLPDLRRL